MNEIDAFGNFYHPHYFFLQLVYVSYSCRVAGL
jgi:hypothetical protein